MPTLQKKKKKDFKMIKKYFEFILFSSQEYLESLFRHFETF